MKKALVILFLSMAASVFAIETYSMVVTRTAAVTVVRDYQILREGLTWYTSVRCLPNPTPTVTK